MADSKVADLTEATALAGDELLYLVDDPSGTPVDRKAKVSTVRRGWVLDTDHSTTFVENSTSETTLRTLSVPAGVVAAGDILRVVLGGFRLNASGGSVNYTYRFKIGATTAIAMAALSQSNNANNRKWAFLIDIFVGATVSAQKVVLHTINSGPTTSAGGYGGDSGAGYGSAAEDLSSAIDLTFTGQMGTAHASAEDTCEVGGLYLMKAA